MNNPQFLQRIGLLLQILFGGLVGAALALISFPISAVIELSLGPGEEGGQFFVGFMGPALMYPVGAALGVSLVGRRLERRGKFWYALIGAFGAMMVLGMLGAVLTSSSDLVITVLLVLIVVLPPLFAAVTYHRFARPTDPVNPYDDGEVDLLQYHKEGWEDYD